LASEAKPAIELAETANPLTSLQPNIIAGDIDTEINTDITEDVISDIGEDLVVADITDTTSGLETDIISLPDSIEDSPESDKTAIEVSTPLNEIAEPEISLPQLQLEPANVIFPGLLDLTRHDNTGPIGGCASINKGLTMGGGFMLFTCEKLLPYIEISEHKNTYDAYKNLFLSEGWSETPSQEPAKNKLSFSRVDYLECEVVVDMELWIDRSMNETILDKSDRDAYRQIVFKAWFRGDACQGHYDAAELLVGR